ncbi:MAG TPA: cobalamin biosynthesis protein CbiM [bacterium]|nr:cobalamin biosynthesis protein CbiM [bacterium]
MHISDGIIQTPVCLAAHAVCAAAIYISGRNTEQEDIPKMGMTGAALFTASLIHFPFAGTSIHLGLFGLAGIILGRRAFPVIYAALFLQSLIFQHGGLLTLGVNALNMGAGAWGAWLLWRVKRLPESLRAPSAGFLGILIPALLMAFEFNFSGYGKGIFYLLTIYLAVAVIESGITFSAVRFFRKVKADILP